MQIQKKRKEVQVPLFYQKRNQNTNGSQESEKHSVSGCKIRIGGFLAALVFIFTMVSFPLRAESTQTLILNQPSSTVEKAKIWAIYKLATEEFVSLADLYWEISPAVGVDPAVAYAQAAHETGFGRFGGVLDASFHNPCGLKTRAGGDNYDPNAHTRFPDWETGIKAHVDHLALYAGAAGFPDPNSPDPRHFPSLFGTALTVEGLSTRWAPSETYGDRVRDYVYGIHQIVEDGMELFIIRLYSAGLDREADTVGLEFWINELKSGKIQGAGLVEHFLLSEELKNKNLSDRDYLQVLYVTIMDRPGDESGIAFWEDLLSNGSSRTGVLRHFILSTEFQNLCARYGLLRGYPDLFEARDQNLFLTSFINRQYQEILGRTGDITGLNHWSRMILRQNTSLESAAGEFLRSKEFTDKRYNDEDYIKILYRAFMGRESDPGGLTYWIETLQQSTSTSSQARQEIYRMFAASDEFKNIIRSYGLTPSA